MIQSLLNLDGQALLWIQEYLRHSAITPVVVFITEIGNAGAVWIIISLVLLAMKRTRRIGLIALCSLLGAFIINNVILKNVVGRIRPYDAVNGLNLIIERQIDSSFPSGHTGSSFACAVVLFLELPKKYGVPALILAFLIGLSRLYVGVHYPTDVLAGAVFGTIIAILVRRFMRRNQLKVEI